MSDKDPATQIIVAVVVALLVGGTAPWWWQEFFSEKDPEPTPTLTPTPTHTPTPVEPSTPPETPTPVDDISDQEEVIQRQLKDSFGSQNFQLRPPVAPPANFACPNVPGAAWLQSPQFWYGPYSDRYSYINYISYDQYNIYVNSSGFGMNTYPDPASFGGRNKWWPLNTAPFNICVDQQGRVFVYFSG